MTDIYFEKANLKHEDVIFSWLSEPHIQEFWDNSEEHKDDIKIFIEGRKIASTYFDGIFTYWIAVIDQVPYALIMTAEVLDDADCNELWKNYLSKTGKTFSIDFCIGNKELLGKGLAAPTLEAFVKFYHKVVDHKADTFFIDPDESNPKAKHVYEKAGFQQVGEFIMKSGAFAGHKTELMVKSLDPSLELVHQYQ